MPPRHRVIEQVEHAQLIVPHVEPFSLVPRRARLAVAGRVLADQGLGAASEALVDMEIRVAPASVAEWLIRCQSG